jgi:hypothetical protein
MSVHVKYISVLRKSIQMRDISVVCMYFLVKDISLLRMSVRAENISVVLVCPWEGYQCSAHVRACELYLCNEIYLSVKCASKVSMPVHVRDINEVGGYQCI